MQRVQMKVQRIDLGKLRHPALVRLRTDLNSEGE